MRNEITVGDFKTIYFKIIDTEDEIRERIYLNEEEAKINAEKNKGKVMKITKRIMQTMRFERIH